MLKRFIALLLCALLLAAAPVSVLAAGNGANTTIIPVFTSITYHSSLEDVSDYSRFAGSGATFDDEWSGWGAPDRLALAGWAAAEGGALVYDLGAEIPEGVTEAWAVWTPLCLGEEEVFSFNNSSWYFDVDGSDKYYMSEEDYSTMQLNLFKNFGVGPVPSPVISIVLSTYPDWEWQGSCYGMSAVVALQHFGLIDALSLQDAETLSELDADEELVSFINYYQSQVATSWLTENKAYFVGTPMFRAQMQKLFETVSAGNLCIFTFYEDQPIITPGHAVLFTGAYDAADGSHVLIAYDSNCPWEYENGEFTSRFVISPDYTAVSYEGETLGAVNWTDNFEQMTSFAIDRSGSPVAWYRAFFRHISETLNALVRMFRLLAA